MSSPLHLPGPPDVAWTRGNLGEALPGLCTPLSWTFFGPATEDGLRSGFRRIGALSRRERPVPDEVGRRFATVMFGWPAANIDMMARMAERLPGVDPAQVERELFGEARDVGRQRTLRRYPFVAARMPLTVALCLRQVRARRAGVEQWWRVALARLRSTEEDEALAQLVLAEARSQFVELMALHSIISMVASGAHDQLVALSAASGSGDPVQHAARLITGYGTVEETQVADDLWAYSRHELTVEQVLDRHGWHGINNGQLHTHVWREDPGWVKRLAEHYREMPDDQRPSARAARQREQREQAEDQLLAPLPRVAAIRPRLLLGLVQRFIAHREVGKAGYLIAVDGARAAARSLGQAWRRTGSLDDPDDVFLLTLREVQAGPTRDWGELVNERRAERDGYAAARLPDAWIGVPVPIPICDVALGSAEHVDTAADDPAPIRGIGVNGGIVEGVARVVLDPEGEFEPGEILVCATTDPSWAPVFVAAAAVVIDIGGHLSHGAIVARELGIPCVVNTRDGSRRIRSGDRLRVNVATGQITILQPT